MLKTAIVNQKGGVGKTTVTLELGAQLAITGKKVLLADLDPQANLTSGLGEKENAGATVYDLLTNKASFSETVKETATKNLFLLPAERKLAGLETELAYFDEKEFLLQKALEATNDFDYAFFDCPPSLGLLSVNALVAANKVLVPVLCEYYSLEGLKELLKTVKLVKKYLNPDLSLDGLVFSRFDNRLGLDKYISDSLQNSFGSAVYKARIPKNVTVAEAAGRGMPASIIFKNCKGSEAYKRLAEEFSEKQEAYK